MQLLRKDKPLTPSWDLVKPSIQLVRDNVWPIFYLSFLPSLIAVVGIVLMQNNVHAGTNTIVWGTRSIIGVLLVLTGSVWTGLAYPGTVIFELAAVRGEHPEALDCFKRGLRRLFPMIGMVIVEAVVISLGLVALIVPGLILIRGLYLAQYYLIDKNLKPIEALKASYEASKPHAGYIWGIIGVGVVFGLLSSGLGQIPVAGYIISILIGLIYVFAPALRYSEIEHDYEVKKTDV